MTTMDINDSHPLYHAFASPWHDLFMHSTAQDLIGVVMLGLGIVGAAMWFTSIKEQSR